ncbi:MAG: S41 family peptidase [Acidobacteria bacterium]|nr:S41 family peptidase [Acidobacteriota bacterium]
MKMRVIVGILMVTGLVTFAGLAQTNLTVTGEPSKSDIPQTVHGKVELWRQDLQHLAKELPRRHKNAFHTVSREAFERTVAELDAALPTLQEPEIVVRIQQILAQAGDGHTFLTGFPARTRYPLSLFWFGNELRVVRTSAAYRQALGTRVVSIGELSLAEATAKVSRIISTDNEYWTRHVSAMFLAAPEVLFALKVLPNLARGQWTFEEQEGKAFSLEMDAVAPETKVEWLLAAKEAPLYRQRADERFWFAPLPEAQTLYVNLRGYPDTDDFKRSADELLKQVDATQPKRLVLDVRQNEGGDLKKGRYLLAGLKKRSVFTARGSVYVIIGRATASAAMANAIDFRNELNATLVGEPTGGRPNSYSENEYFFLPNSKLKISYSTKFHKFQDTDTPALMPDKLIEPTWGNYQAGRDAVLEWILAQPLSKSDA